MKSAILPQVRVEPELRAELEAQLRKGETLSQFVEASVRRAVEVRREQALFYARGEAAWEDYQRTGLSVSVDEVFAKLQHELDLKRQQLGL